MKRAKKHGAAQPSCRNACGAVLRSPCTKPPRKPVHAIRNQPIRDMAMRLKMHVEVERGHAGPAQEDLAREVCHGVAVQEHAGGVHGDEGRDLGVAAGGALDDVGGPGAVVKA